MASPMTDVPPQPEPRPRRPPRARLLPASFLSPTSLACFLLVAVLGLTADLWLKAYSWDKLVQDVEFYDGVASLSRRNLAADVLAPGVYDVVLVPHVLELTAVANQGAAMGMGQGHQTLFLLVSVAAIAVLFYFFAFSGGKRLYQVVLGLLLAGVLGNLYDRVAYGYVRDMLHLFPGVHWSDLLAALPGAELFPWVFNLADVYLCIGVPAVLIYGMFAAPPRPADDAAGEPRATEVPALDRDPQPAAGPS